MRGHACVVFVNETKISSDEPPSPGLHIQTLAPDLERVAGHNLFNKRPWPAISTICPNGDAFHMHLAIGKKPALFQDCCCQGVPTSNESVQCDPLACLD